MPTVGIVKHELLEQIVLAAVRARPDALQKSNLVQMLGAIGIHPIDARRIIEDLERVRRIYSGGETGKYIS